jgi:threonine synthase
VSEILNQFFTCNITSWDVEFCIGRYPVKIEDVGHRVLAAQTWHNLVADYAWAEKSLAEYICGSSMPAQGATGWVKIAIRIAFLTGVFGELIRKGIADPEHPVDVAVPTGDFAIPMSVWYARQMGLPMANIICSSEESSFVWDLLQWGTVKTDEDVREHLERLICGVLGQEECVRFVQTCAMQEEHSLLGIDKEKLRKGMFAAVISKDRLVATIPSVYRTRDYILGPAAALGYSGLLDYRAKTGENRTALLLAERSPMCDCDFVARVMNMTVPELRAKIK